MDEYVEIACNNEKILAILLHLRTARLEIAMLQLEDIETTVEKIIKNNFIKKSEENLLIRKTATQLVDKIMNLQARLKKKNTLYLDEIPLCLNILSKKTTNDISKTNLNLS